MDLPAVTTDVDVLAHVMDPLVVVATSNVLSTPRNQALKLSTAAKDVADAGYLRCGRDLSQDKPDSCRNIFSRPLHMTIFFRRF